MSQAYREVVQDFLGGWTEQQEQDIREKALIELASYAGEALSQDEGKNFADRELLEDYLDGEETIETEQLKTAIKHNNNVFPPEPERLFKEAERNYSEQRAEEGLEQPGVETSFDISERTVDIKIPESNYLEVLETFQDYDGQINLKLEKKVSLDIEDEQEMREKAEPQGEWGISSISPSISFNGGTIKGEYDTDRLVIEAHKYTQELEQVLDEFGL